jgi:hypothetical protein
MGSWRLVGGGWVRLSDDLLDDGVGEVDLRGSGGLYAREGIAQDHEFVDLGDDAVLFRRGRQCHGKRSHISRTYVFRTDSFMKIQKHIKRTRRRH